MPRAPRQRGLGSGVIVSARRLHPDQQPRRRRRRRHPRRTRPTAARSTAKLVGTDKPSDLALLKVDATDLHAAGARQLRRRAGRRRRARGRQPARHRPDGDDGHHQREGPVDRRRRRQLRGLPADRRADQPRQLGRRAGEHRRANWSASTRRSCRPSDGNIGIGFAIPANMARHVMDQLRTRRPRPPRAARRDGAAGDVGHGGEPRPEGGRRRDRQRGRRRAARPSAPGSSAATSSQSFNGQPVQRHQHAAQPCGRHGARARRADRGRSCATAASGR